MKEILLMNGGAALVDDADYEKLVAYNWSRLENRVAAKTCYANACIKIDGKWKTVQMHRLILGASGPLVVDHINGDGLDNRRINLRLCTRSQNRMNSRPNAGTASGYKGVSAHYNKFQAAIYKAGHNPIRLGTFSTAIEAARAYDAAARELFGEFARCNNV